MKKAFKKIALRITSLIFGLNIGLAQAPEADVSAAGFPADEDTLAFFKSIIQNHEVASMAYGVFTSNRLSDNWKNNRAKRHVEITDSTAQLEYINMWTTENFLDEMENVSKKFLVLAAHYDHPQFKLNVQKEVFSNFKDVDFIEIENAGHFPMQETPVFLISSIEDFFLNT